jgi:HD-GYP domain-containing protein (c-di-GMP phosphodiesterase class II)
MLAFPAATQEAVRALDEHWDGRGRPRGLRGDEIPLLARIVCLAQTTEIFAGTYGVEAALAMAAERRGSWFDPALVDALLGLRGDERCGGSCPGRTRPTRWQASSRTTSSWTRTRAASTGSPPPSA